MRTRRRALFPGLLALALLAATFGPPALAQTPYVVKDIKYRLFEQPQGPHEGGRCHLLRGPGRRARWRAVEERRDRRRLAGRAVPWPEATRDNKAYGHCGVPATARALALNVTVTAPEAAGHVRLFPTGQALPTIATVNYSAGQTRGGNGIVALGANRGVHGLRRAACGNDRRGDHRRRRLLRIGLQGPTPSGPSSRPPRPAGMKNGLTLPSYPFWTESMA